MKGQKHNKPMGFLPLVLLFLTLLMARRMDAKEIFAQLTEMPNVESTFISGKMGSSIMTLPEISRMTRNGVWLESDDFKAIFIYRCYSEDSVKKAREILANYVKSNKNAELVMRTRQGGQEYTMYEVTKPGRSNASQRAKLIILNADASNVCQVVVIDWEELPDLSQLKKTEDPLRYVQGRS